ncbi:MAG: RloB family protein [Pseudomonadota bacterium]
MSLKNLRDLKRRKNFRSIRKNFLIVCEGEKTETNYFNKFRVSKEIYGAGANTESLVKIAIDLKNNAKIKFDKVWCVFDRDSFSPQNFNSAFILAKNNDIKIAYSNEAFEIWYLLHFNYHDSATSRRQYEAMLTERLGFQYKKNDNSMFDCLIHLQDDAIRNANKLLNSYVNRSPLNANPSTTVHILVQELNQNSV